MDDRERARQRYEQRTASSWYKLTEGENTFRVLPTPKSAKTDGSFLEFLLHREVGPRKTAVRCGKDIYGKGKCWLCDVHMHNLRQKGQEARAAALEPKAVFTVQVAKVSDDGKMSGPMIFQPSKTIADQILSMFFSKKKVYQDAVKGYNLTLSRTGTGKNDTRYGMIEADEESSKVPQTIIDRLKPFSELTEIPVYSELKQKAAVSGKDLVQDDEGEEEEEEQVIDEEEEEEPVKPTKVAAKKTVASKKVKPEPEEEEDEEVEPDEDTEEEIDLDELDDEEEEVEPVKPAAKKTVPAKKSAKPVPVVEEEEDEELDDEEEPEPPKKTASVKKAAPAKKVAAKPVPIEDDEDEELIDLDDEEEPEPPKKPAKKVVKKK